jgi:hypothetical protein
VSTENTPRSNLSQEQSPPILGDKQNVKALKPKKPQREPVPPPAQVDRFRGVPLEMICDIREIPKELNIKAESWKQLKDAGLPILIRVGDVSIGLTTEIVAFLKTQPELGPRPSTIRKQRQIARKERKK